MKDNYFKFTPSVWIVPTILLGCIWVVFWTDQHFGLQMGQYGIEPRRFLGLRGLFLSPFIHRDLGHIANNSVPLFVLSLALIYFYRAASLKVLFYGILFSGLLTWLIGRDSHHIGASGLIYVLVSFLFFKGIKTGYYRLMALSMAVVISYGGLIWFVFPQVDSSISWEGHLAGLITGFVFAQIIKTPNYIRIPQFEWQKPNFDPSKDEFMSYFDANGQFVNRPKVAAEWDFFVSNLEVYRMLPTEIVK